jgi:diguanylate cyclase (GGDEF)-like protein/PAS domain S-box-containing protein
MGVTYAREGVGTAGVGPRPPERRRTAILPYVVIPIVVFCMLGALLFLERQSERARSVQGSLADAATSVYQLDSFSAAWLRDSSDVRPNDAATLAQLQDGVSGAFDALAGAGSNVAILITDYQEYQTALVRAVGLRLSGHAEAAVALYTAQVTPAFNQLSSHALASADLLRSQVESAEKLREIGSVMTLALGALMLAFAVRRNQRQRRGLIAIQTREAAVAEARRFISLMEGSSDLVTVFDRDARVTFQSASIEHVLGWSVRDVVGHDFHEFLDPQDIEGFDALLASAEAHPGFRQSVEWRLRKADGGLLSVEAIVASRFEDPDIRGMLVNVRDISERVVLEDAMRHRAFHDSLTGLGNRILFEDRLEHALDRSARSGGTVCVLLADLDDFKDVNDTLGHASGDQVLLQAAQRLASCVRSEDTLARVGGDAFAILVEETDGHEGALVAERIVSALSASIPLDGGEFFVHASIGIATGSRAGRSEDISGPTLVGQMLVEADLAMHEAKLQARGRFRFYTPAMQEGIVERMSMRSDLERGLTRGEFVLHYQPIVSIASGAVIGAEALVRWQHPQRGLVPPLSFIPLAEQTGMIIELGRWVLRSACAEAATWPEPIDGGTVPYVSVNVAGSQLQQPGFVVEVLGILESSGLDASRLVLEMTESALIEDSDHNTEKLRQLQQIGVSLAIDDFGTGYSSLSYLRHFSMDILKIDKSFVDRLGHDPMDSALVAAMVGLGSSLGMQVIAEGIEDRGQLEDLRALNCDLGQGYLFSKPVQASAFAAMLFPEVATAQVSAERA